MLRPTVTEIELLLESNIVSPEQEINTRTLERRLRGTQIGALSKSGTALRTAII